MKYDGVTIYSEYDEYGPVEVVQNRSTRKLYFGTAIEQSSIFLNAPMQLSFEYHEKMLEVYQTFLNQKPKTNNPQALVLGLGGGSLVTHLHLHHSKLPITAVELREHVIYCASQYFHLPTEPQITVQHADALTFVATNRDPYQVIFIDLYNEQGMPSEFYGPQFQQNLLLNLPQKLPGLVIFNLWNDDQPACNNLIDYWQTEAKENKHLTVNRYQIQSSENIILAIQI